MWTAVGSCYQSASIAQTADAIRAFRKAVSLGDQDGVALDRLAELYQESGQLGESMRAGGRGERDRRALG